MKLPTNLRNKAYHKARESRYEDFWMWCDKQDIDEIEHLRKLTDINHKVQAENTRLQSRINVLELEFERIEKICKNLGRVDNEGFYDTKEGL